MILRSPVMVRTLVCVVCLCVSTLFAAPVTFTGSGGSLVDFNAGGGVPGDAVFNINVANSGVVSNAPGNVVVRLVGFDHSFASDLTVTLTHQGSGISRTLFGRVNLGGPGESSNFNDNYTFSPSALDDLWSVTLLLGDVDDIPGDSALPPFAYFPTDEGSSLPNDLQAAFRGLAAAGVWTLTISDFAAGDTGNLQSWELTLDLDPASAVPEPSMTALLAAALGVICWRQRRK